MKKAITILTAIICISLLSACNASNQPENKTVSNIETHQEIDLTQDQLKDIVYGYPSTWTSVNHDIESVKSYHNEKDGFLTVMVGQGHAKDLTKEYIIQSMSEAEQDAQDHGNPSPHYELIDFQEFSTEKVSGIMYTQYFIQSEKPAKAQRVKFNIDDDTYIISISSDRISDYSNELNNIVSSIDILS